MPKVSSKVPQANSSTMRGIVGTRSNQTSNGSQVVVMRNGGSSGSGGSVAGRNHSGQSTLPSSPNNSG